MNHSTIPNGHQWELEDGVLVRVIDTDWGRRGKPFCDLEVLTPGGQEALAGGSLDLSDTRRRYEIALNVTSRNGATAQKWDNVLLAIYEAVNQEHRVATFEVFDPVWLSEFDEPPPPQQTIQGLVPRDMTTTLYGDSGQGKSTMANHIALCIATGTPFLGMDVIQGRVCILDWELDQSLTLWRIYQIARGMGLQRPPEGIAYQSLYTPLKDRMSDIIEWVSSYSPEILIIDSFGPASGGDPMDQNLATELMTMVRKIPASRLIIDHQANPVAGSKYSNRRAFGSAWKTHLTRSSIQIEATTNVPGKLSGVLRNQKNNFGPKSQEILFHIIFDGPKILVERGNVTEKEFQATKSLPVIKKLEAFLSDNRDKRWTTAELAEKIDAQVNTVRNKLGFLKGRNKIKGEKPNGQRELEWFWLG